jgi:hypothetical protein
MKKIITLLIFSFLFTGCVKEKKMNFEGSKNQGLLSLVNNFSGSGNDTSIDYLELEETVVEEVSYEDKSNVSRKLIKNGRIIFESEDLNKTKSQVLLLVKKYKGYISSDRQNDYDNRINNHLKIRIPSQNFDTILSGISKEVKEFDTKEITISDVTEEFLDIEARLKNKKELEKRFLEILQKAKTVKEILDVEKEIGQLREDIESAEGKLKYLQNQVSFSTLDVSFYKTVYNETNFARKFKNAFKNGFENLKSFLIGLINIWPFVILLGFIFFLFRKWRKKRKNK